ncbi:hypothetical protein [Catenulispora subtropica]|uniref:Uncharacterized protein n=1 Tax=Catenulispora subtropica TaxID=450798 RepID=A0ABN2TDR0_9ACTN
MTLPPEIEMRVVEHLYRDADKISWDGIAAVTRSGHYDRWVNDQEIGGRLQKFMDEKECRHWIKDGPMKERARAVYGVGKYASLVPNPVANPSQLVAQGVGTGWEVDETTLDIKPLRIVARREDDVIRFCWGKPKDLKHLVWAALNAEAKGDPIPWTLCVVGTFTHPIPANQRESDLRLAKRCMLRIVHVSLL